jgi:hypothetical protein
MRCAILALSSCLSAVFAVDASAKRRLEKELREEIHEFEREGGHREELLQPSPGAVQADAADGSSTSKPADASNAVSLVELESTQNKAQVGEQKAESSSQKSESAKEKDNEVSSGFRAKPGTDEIAHLRKVFAVMNGSDELEEAKVM